MTNGEDESIRKVLSRYYEFFGLDSAIASSCFGEPSLIVTPNGVILLETHAKIEATLEQFAAGLRPAGFSHSAMGDCRPRLLNSTTALCSVVAIRVKTDGSEMSRAGFIYLLCKGGAGWRIHEFIATDLDKLVDGSHS